MSDDLWPEIDTPARPAKAPVDIDKAIDKAFDKFYIANKKAAVKKLIIDALINPERYKV